MQAFNWMNGVFFGATLGSETTAAADGQGRRRAPRPDGDAALLRLQHGRRTSRTGWRCRRKMVNPPKVFLVNWFRKGKDGKFLWPGYGENMRVLKWIVDRARLRVGGQETPFGWVPKAGDLDLSGLDIPHEQVDEATHIDLDEWTDRARVDRRVLQDARPEPAQGARPAPRGLAGAPEDHARARWAVK